VAIGDPHAAPFHVYAVPLAWTATQRLLDPHDTAVKYETAGSMAVDDHVASWPFTA